MENEYLDFDQAVVFLKTTPSTLYKWLQAGKIPGHKLGRQWRFLKEELEIHVSGKGPKITIQKDFLTLSELLLSRSKTKEKKMELNTNNLPEQIIWDAFDHGSRLVHIYPAKGKFDISYRTKNGIQKLSSIQEDSFYEIDNILTKNSTETADGGSRRLYLHRGDEDVLQIKYQKIETVSGPRLTLRMWQPEKDVLPLNQISKDTKTLEIFQGWMKKSHGLILVSGAAGSGKTTTVYSLLNEFKNQGRIVFTIEDSAELVIEGINQIEIKGKAQTHFEETFDQVYSSDPDVICLGLGSYIGIEEKVFSAAYKAASTGHLIIIQMDQPSCKEAVETFKKFVKYPSEHLITGVSCQKLVEENGNIRAVYEFLDI
jgi:type IV pilus assembly protein PilB